MSAHEWRCVYVCEFYSEKAILSVLYYYFLEGSYFIKMLFP